MSFSAGSPLLVYCTEACVGFLLFCVWCWVSLAGVLHIVLVLVVSCLLFGAGSPLLVYCTLFLCLSLFVLSCFCTVLGFGLGIFVHGRQGSIPWRSWRAGSVWGCSLPWVDP